MVYFVVNVYRSKTNISANTQVHTEKFVTYTKTTYNEL